MLDSAALEVKEWENVKVGSAVFEHRLLAECQGLFVLSETHTLEGMLDAAKDYEDLCTLKYKLQKFIYKMKKDNISDKYIEIFDSFIEKTDKKLNLIKN